MQRALTVPSPGGATLKVPRNADPRWPSPLVDEDWPSCHHSLVLEVNRTVAAKVWNIKYPIGSYLLFT